MTICNDICGDNCDLFDEKEPEPNKTELLLVSMNLVKEKVKSMLTHFNNY